jgi:hypothetical protein
MMQEPPLEQSILTSLIISQHKKVIRKKLIPLDNKSKELVQQELKLDK